MSNHCSASLQITSLTLSADEIEKRFPSIAGDSHNVGEPISTRQGSAKYQQSILRIESSLPNTASVNEHCEHLLSKLKIHSDEMAGLSSECTIEIWVKVSFHGSQLGFDIEPSTSAKLGAMRTNLVLDIYYSGDRG
jgi:hypothetical protein